MKPDPETVTATVLGEWVALSEQRLHALARENVIPRIGKSHFDLKAAVRAYVEHLRVGQLGRLTSNPGLTAEKERLAREQADAMELKNGQARGELVPAAEVAATWAMIITDLRAALLAVPARLDCDLGTRAAVDRELRDALDRIATDA